MIPFLISHKWSVFMSFFVRQRVFRVFDQDLCSSSSIMELCMILLPTTVKPVLNGHLKEDKRKDFQDW